MAFNNKGGHEVHHLGGKAINWKNPPKPNARCQWSKRDTSGRVVTGSFRTLCHFNRLNNLATSHLHSNLTIIQPPYNTGVAASAGTHEFDACADVYLPGVGWYRAQRFLRANGFGCWYRHPPAFPYHIHGFTLPLQEGKSRADDFQTGHFTVGLYVDGGWSRYGRQSATSQL